MHRAIAIVDEATVRIVADSRDAERDAATAGRRFGVRFAREADRATSRTNIADGLTRDVEQAAQRIAQARTAESRAAQQVEAAEDRLAAARTRAENAAGRVNVAEQRLQTLRDSGRGTADQLVAAEERVNAARRGAEQANTAVERATTRAADAQARLASANSAVESSIARHRAAQDQLASAMARSGAASESLSQRFRRMGDEGARSATGSVPRCRGSTSTRCRPPSAGSTSAGSRRGRTTRPGRCDGSAVLGPGRTSPG
ncbi:hypothetical protein BJF78_24700 [Pseudonocardia sp. CNS-139]|nr:hypothetical protein BJF78_24700 [Pseudonocardia sp. CNS-139]